MSSYAYDSSNDDLELISGIPRSRLNAVETKASDSIENEGDAFVVKGDGECYSVGSYCIKDNILYKCTTQHIGEWDPDHFTAVNIGDELRLLNYKMNQTSVDKTAVNQGYITTSLNGGTSLNDAVGTFLNNDINLYAKSVEKNDYVNIDLGSSLTNNTGNTIKAGTYFYSFGAVCRAKTDIANNVALTSLNHETTRTGNGALNEINSALTTQSITLTPVANKVTLDNGGAYRIGNVVYVQIKFTINSTTTEYFDGLPTPLQTDETKTLIELTTNPTLTTGAITVSPAGRIRGEASSGSHVCTGCYICK